MKQIYKPYWQWEDYKNGMYNKIEKSEQKNMVDKTLIFMNNTELFGEAMRQVISKWKETMINSLTNPSINKCAFVGQCACSYWINVPESITKQAWKRMTDIKRYEANKIAQKYINKWLLDHETKNKRIHKDMDSPMLF